MYHSNSLQQAPVIRHIDYNIENENMDHVKHACKVWRKKTCQTAGGTAETSASAASIGIGASITMIIAFFLAIYGVYYEDAFLTLVPLTIVLLQIFIMLSVDDSNTTANKTLTPSEISEKNTCHFRVMQEEPQPTSYAFIRGTTEPRKMASDLARSLLPGFGVYSDISALSSGKSGELLVERLVIPVLERIVQDEDIKLSDMQKRNIKQYLRDGKFVEASSSVTPSMVDTLVAAQLDHALATAAAYQLRAKHPETDLTTEQVGNWLRENGWRDAINSDGGNLDTPEKRRYHRIIEDAKSIVATGSTDHVKTLIAFLKKEGEKPVEQQQGTIKEALGVNVSSLLAVTMTKIAEDPTINEKYEKTVAKTTRIITRNILLESALVAAPYLPAVLLMALGLGMKSYTRTA
eukprot:3939400-Rhodomonas_salina.1